MRFRVRLVAIGAALGISFLIPRLDAAPWIQGRSSPLRLLPPAKEKPCRQGS